jgi:L-ribulose-5-phosphate 4-epimerase
VFHVHSPEIWTHRHELGLLETRVDVPYGTPEMANEVRRLFAETDLRERRIFTMAGHEDGLVSFGDTATEAGSRLRVHLTQAREL